MQFIIEVLRKYGLDESIELDSFKHTEFVLLNGNFEVNLYFDDDNKTMAVIDDVGDLIYSGAMPSNKRFAIELLEHLGVPRNK